MLSGYTTGTCATAAALSAALRLSGFADHSAVFVRLPKGKQVEIPVEESGSDGLCGWAVVRKFAGDDPDVTDGALIRAFVERSRELGVRFYAGRGVGIVTRPGLQISPGEPAINPVPRRMITQHLLALGDGWNVEICVDRGEELAQRTFNPRLGIVGGISIIGTTGIVRPFDRMSWNCSIRCALDVALASGNQKLVLVPGNYGERAARRHYRWGDDCALIEIGNDWDYVVQQLTGSSFREILVVGHPGKLAKLIHGHWNTHSACSPSVLPWISQFWRNFSGQIRNEFTTVEGFLCAILEEPRGRIFCDELASLVAGALRAKIAIRTAVALCDMHERIIGESAGVQSWR